MYKKLNDNIVDLSKSKFLNTGIVLGLDAFVSLCASAFVILLINILIPSYVFSRTQIITWLLISFLISLIVYRIGRVYRAIIRYSTLRELSRMFLVCLAKDTTLWVIMAALSLMKFDSGLLTGMVLIDFFVTLCALCLLRIVMIAIYDRIRTNTKVNDNLRHVLVYGIGNIQTEKLSTLLR